VRSRRVSTVLAVGALLVASTAAPALGVQTAQDRVVSQAPAAFTPNVLNGQVNVVVQVGGTMIIGGVFSQVQAAGSTTTLTRNNILAFNATTGALSSTFVPSFDGEVTSLLVAPDGQSVYAGGFFNTVNGQASKSLARLSVATGQLVAGFTPPSMDGRVKDLRLTGGRLWVAGTFATVSGVARPGLVTVNPATGVRDGYFALPIAGQQNGGVTQVLKMDVTPDGSRLVGIGNFTTVGGLPKQQIFLLDLTGPAAALADWQTTFYTSTCAPAFNSYMRDVDISPDGSYFVVSTTGAYRAPPASCDTTARFETGATGTGIEPTWINYTGGDTTYGVAVTGTAVYVGGHMRWENNPLAGDSAGPGAVSREGIAALDPTNGLPLRWNPGRTKGIGVFDMLATPQGLWVASDTDRIGNFSYRARIALLPLAGGTTVPPRGTGTLPGNVYQAGQLTLAGDPSGVNRRPYDGSTAGAASALPPTGIDWAQARGGVMINGALYYGWSDGNFYSRSFNGSAFGAQTAVNTQDLIVPLASWHADVPNITSMFYDGSRGRLYYTLAGQSSLFFRYFTTESNVVGALRFTTNTSLDFGSAAGAFLAGGKLYLASRTDGSLTRLDWANGAPVAGTAAVVTGGGDWRARALVLYAPVGGAPSNQPPVASSAINCTGLACTMSGAGSSDPDGGVVSWAWDFGDGGTASGATVSHTFAAAGTYQVKLTVTDTGGATNAVTKPVTVSVPSTPVSFVGKSSANANATTHTVARPAGITAGDGLLLFATAASPTVTMADPAGWTPVRTVQAANGITTRLWQRVATAAEPANVTVTLSGLAKADLLYLAYRGTAAAGPVAVQAGVAETASTTAHVTPQATSTSSAWVLSYWADNTSASTAWTAPAGQTVRSTSFGTGGGRITSLATDSGAPVDIGVQGGLTATANATTAKATMWTIVLSD
jgi:PKD repeat protein